MKLNIKNNIYLIFTSYLYFYFINKILIFK